MFHIHTISSNVDRVESSATTKDIIETLKFIVGLGATCTLNNASISLNDLFDNNTKLLNTDLFGYDEVCNMVFNKNADIDSRYFKFQTKQLNQTSNDKPLYPKCKCLADKSGFECSDETTFNYPQSYSTITNKTLLNISDSSINETMYYLYTTDLYGLKRYGALSFDNEIIKTKQTFSKAHNVIKLGFVDILAKFNTRRLASVWYNHKAFHSMPIFINTMNNALVRANMLNVLNKIDPGSLMTSNSYGI
jgi:hypothetical protein